MPRYAVIQLRSGEVVTEANMRAGEELNICSSTALEELIWAHGMSLAIGSVTAHLTVRPRRFELVDLTVDFVNVYTYIAMHDLGVVLDAYCASLSSMAEAVNGWAGRCYRLPTIHGGT